MPEIKHQFGQVRAIPQNVEETRTIEFVISSNTKDRHGTVLPVDKWQLDRFNANGIVGYQHNVYGGDLCNAPDPDQVIGKGRAWVEGDQLIGSVEFEPAELNPLAEKIFRKVLFGTLQATSVGFNPTAPTYFGQGEEARGGKNQTEYYAGQELLEFSIVNIPSNPDALKRSMRDQASNAISYIYRQFGGQFRFADIEDMSIRNVLELLEKTPEERALSVKVEMEVTLDNSEANTPPENPDENLNPDNLEPETSNLELAQREFDEDLILITRSKLALTANS